MDAKDLEFLHAAIAVAQRFSSPIHWTSSSSGGAPWPRYRAGVGCDESAAVGAADRAADGAVDGVADGACAAPASGEEEIWVMDRLCHKMPCGQIGLL